MSSPSIRSLALIAALLIGAALPSNTHAQRAADDRGIGRDSVAAPTTVRSDSSISSATTGPRIAPAGIVVPANAIARNGGTANDVGGLNAGSNVAMMGVGAAGIIVGSMVGGDSGTIIAVGGAVIGLIGLFRFLR